MLKPFYMTRFRFEELLRLRDFAKNYNPSSPRFANWLLDEIAIELRRRRENERPKIPQEPAPISMPFHKWQGNDLAGAFKSLFFVIMEGQKNDTFSAFFKYVGGYVGICVVQRLKTSELPLLVE